FFHDQGAYLRTHAVTVPDLAAAMLPGPYRVPAYRAAGHVRLTNKTPCGTYRAPGRFESTFVRERLLDAIAARLAIDPIVSRRRNLIARAEMPYRRALDTLGTEVELDSGDYAGLLDKILAHIGWPALQQRLAQRRAHGELVRAGLAMFVGKSGLRPRDNVRRRGARNGAVEVVAGAAPLGQGIETVVAQICADALGVDYANVRVVHGQTDRIDFGMGAFASRATVMTGEATRITAENLRANAIAAAAELLQAPPERLDVIDGKILRVDQIDGPSMTLGEGARALAGSGKTNTGMSSDGWFHCDHMNYPYGIHIAVVAVDHDTGGVEVERYVVAYDIGKAVNPMLIEGQIVGGVLQGLGGALYEDFRYDERGEPLSVTFADYLMPTAREAPP